MGEKKSKKKRAEEMTSVVAEFLAPDGQVVKALSEQEVRQFKARGYQSLSE